MAEKGHILVVCTANICRSPMAAALLQHALAAQPEPLRSLKVVSAGVACRGGEKATECAVGALKKVGVTISGHISRPVTQELLDEALVVLCMTESHRSAILLKAEPAPRRIHLFREFMQGEDEKEIADPFGGNLRVYEACRDELVEAIPSVIEFLKGLPLGPALR